MFELPFQKGEGFGALPAGTVQEYLDFLVTGQEAHLSQDKYFWMADSYPAASLSLRSASAENIVLQVQDGGAPWTLGEVDMASAPRPPRSGAAAAGLAAPILLALTFPARADTSLERQFLWDQANAQMASAHGDADFLQAAETYRRLANAGACNGPLFYNLGPAFLQAKRYDEATRSFLRAERYLGSDPELAINLELALVRGKSDIAGALPWYRVPLFWHYGLAAPLRLHVAVAAFAAAWLGLALMLAGRRTAGRRLLAAALVALALFGSSVVTTFIDESRDKEGDWLKPAVATPSHGPRTS